MKRFVNLTIVAVLCFVGFAGAQQPSRFDWLGVKEDVAKLKMEVAELKADLVAIKARASAPATQPVGYVAVTAAKEVNGFHPIKAAVNVATAPARMLQRVCDGGVCRMVEVDVPMDSVQAAPAFQGDCSSGNCSNGQCGMQTQRRGFFGRKRGW